MPSRTPSHASNTPDTTNAPHSERAIAPLAGLLLVAMTVVLAVGVTAATTLDSPAEPAPTVVMSMEVEGDRITLDHDGGDPIAVDELSVRVSVNGEPLARQPPVPFFSASGFRPGPTGAFNAASDDEWVVGGSASFRIAGTNDPSVEPGDRVTLRLLVREQPIATLEATARSG
ncbi:type IV pilin N-terminal domain-containing protein [Halorubrum sp. F4]|uniref:type IV pilin N-terminal domain-containing protein n=1 Tax=Halorubrum sp. F4 TaxID=2989715 RepID=UPI00248179EC|nr:type IV pilin N-terminal domain-containing protein [Halorubrum sp. F4]